MVALQVVFATRQNAPVVVFIKNKSSPFVPLVLSVFCALFRVAMNVIRISLSGIYFRKLASTRFVSQSFCCALFAISRATLSGMISRSTYFTRNPFDKFGLGSMFKSKSFLGARCTVSIPTGGRLALLFAGFARFPDNLRIGNGFIDYV